MRDQIPEHELEVAALSAALGRTPDYTSAFDYIWEWDHLLRPPRYHPLRVDYWERAIEIRHVVYPAGSWSISIGDPLWTGRIIAAPGFDDVMRKLQDPKILGRYSKKSR